MGKICRKPGDSSVVVRETRGGWGEERARLKNRTNGVEGDKNGREVERRESEAEHSRK